MVDGRTPSGTGNEEGTAVTFGSPCKSQTPKNVFRVVFFGGQTPSWEVLGPFGPLGNIFFPCKLQKKTKIAHFGHALWLYGKAVWVWVVPPKINLLEDSQTNPPGIMDNVSQSISLGRGITSKGASKLAELYGMESLTADGSMRKAKSPTSGRDSK